MVLVEKDVPVAFENVDISRGAHHSDAHLARNPFGRIPVLEHRGLQVYESQAINRYLDAVLPGPALMRPPWLAAQSSISGRAFKAATSSRTPATWCCTRFSCPEWARSPIWP